MAHIKDSHIAKTEWPDTPIPDAAKRLIDCLLDIMDHNTEDAGDKLATEIFTPDGVLSTSASVACGEAEIRVSRKQPWEIVNYRRHDVVKVYSHKDDASDLLWIGDAALILKNDKEVRGPFLAQIVFENVHSEDVRVNFVQVWGDLGPMLKILQEHPIGGKSYFGGKE